MRVGTIEFRACYDPQPCELGEPVLIAHASLGDRERSFYLVRADGGEEYWVEAGPLTGKPLSTPVPLVVDEILTCELRAWQQETTTKEAR